MERTLSVNYPVLRQDKCVLLNTVERHHGRKIQHCKQGRIQDFTQGDINLYVYRAERGSVFARREDTHKKVVGRVV